jgi:hypothetical protein
MSLQEIKGILICVGGRRRRKEEEENSKGDSVRRCNI